MNVAKYTDDFLKRLVQSFVSYSAEPTWLEFKRNMADPQKLGRYLSGLSNAALLADQPYGYLVYGIDDLSHKIVGTTFAPLSAKLKGGERGEMLIHWLQRGIEQSQVSFDVFDTEIDGKKVVLFEVEAAKNRPTEFYGAGYCRVGSSLAELKRNISLEREIFNHLASDWTSRTVPGIGLESLDHDAVQFARKQYADKYKESAFASEILKWDDWTFLHKAKLAVDGKLTFAALILVGNEESEHWMFPSVARVTWSLMSTDGRIRDYIHFKPPMMLAVDQVYAKIRNLTIREMPDGTLFPRAIAQYERWVLREALHNCIAHQDYSRCCSITVSEFEDHVELANAGTFAPGSVKAALETKRRPRNYRNRQLVDAMVELKMIDTAGMGIKTMFAKQRERAMPMPDYDLEQNEVRVSILGHVIDPRYSNLLLQNADVTLEQAILLDKIQKGLRIEKRDADSLREVRLVEGRYPRLYPAASVASKTGNEKTYLSARGFDTKFYKQRILELICMKGTASLSDIFAAVEKFLPTGRSRSANKRKISSLLSMTMSKREGLVSAVAPRVSLWKLTEEGVIICKNGNSSCRRKCPGSVVVVSSC